MDDAPADVSRVWSVTIAPVSPSFATRTWARTSRPSCSATTLSPRAPLGAEPLTIGRDEENDLVLDDRRVSRRHAEIRLRLRRHTLYDLQSTNGTYVNGRRVAEVVLSDGDRIAIGGSEMVLQQQEASAAS